MSSKPRVCLVSPALAADNNGNWHTAARWAGHLAPLADTTIVQRWDGEDAALLIALHARRSADSIERFRLAHPRRPIALVLTGTDVYRDIAGDASAQRSLHTADRLVCLQDHAPTLLPDAGTRAKACVIVQGCEAIADTGPRSGHFVAVGHLRAEKDPSTLIRAAGRLAGGQARILHIGAPLDAALAAEAEAAARELPGTYRWAGALPHAETRRHIASARALVHMSRIEGGANVVIEAIRSATPVLASRIGGNEGLLGETYAGYFPPGDDAALAALMARCVADPALPAQLSRQCAALAPRHSLEAEAAAVQALLHDCLDTEGYPVGTRPA